MDWKYLLTSFDGRINRPRWWGGMVAVFLVNACAGILDGLMGFGYRSGSPGFVGGVAALVSLYFLLALHAKRWHDRDKSGWWTLILFVPLIGGIWILVELGLLEGSRGANRYGPDPLA